MAGGFSSEPHVVVATDEPPTGGGFDTPTEDAAPAAVTPEIPVGE